MNWVFGSKSTKQPADKKMSPKKDHGDKYDRKLPSSGSEQDQYQISYGDGDEQGNQGHYDPGHADASMTQGEFLRVVPRGQASPREPDREVAIGIDLGTTYACIAVCANGKVEVIQNERGNRKTPSCISFVNQKRVFIGESALEQGYSRRAKNTVFASKYFLGKTTSDRNTFDDLDCFPFTLNIQNQEPVFHLDFEDGTSYEQRPEEISCLLFKAMKAKAERFLNAKVTKAVVSVPSHFNTKHREKTKEACVNADMEVIDIINDTTAAAIAYIVDKEMLQQDQRTVLVIDQGGSSLSVSLLTVQNGTFRTLATTGADGLGGEEINNRLFKHFANKFKEENNGINMTNVKKAVSKLRVACEKVKVQLSITEDVSLEVDALYEGEDFQISMNRQDFNAMNQDLFLKITACVQSVLDIGGLGKEDVKDVLLVGGTTRIPKIREYIGGIFKPEQIKKGINADEAVAYGAAVRAACLTNPFIAINLQLEEITPIEYVLRFNHNLAEIVFARYTSIPAKAERILEVGCAQTLTLETKYDGLTGRPKIISETLKAAGQDAGKYVLQFELDGCGLFKCSCSIEMNTGKPPVMKTIFQTFPGHDNSVYRALAEEIKVTTDTNKGNDNQERPKESILYSILTDDTASRELTIRVQAAQHQEQIHNYPSDGASKYPSGQQPPGGGQNSTSFVSANTDRFLTFCQDLDKYSVKTPSNVIHPIRGNYLNERISRAKQHVIKLRDANLVTKDDLLKVIKSLDKTFNEVYGVGSRGIALYSQMKDRFLKSLMEDNTSSTLSSTSEIAELDAKIEIYSFFLGTTTHLQACAWR